MSERHFILSPSLLSADCGNLSGVLQNLKAVGVQWVHWDVMDGNFVPNITFGQHVIKNLRPRSDLFFDIHLMIDAPERYIDDFKTAGADMLCIHAEATRHLHRTVNAVRSIGMQVGVALCPATPLSVLDYILDDVDMVLLMSVNPGFGGQKFIPATYEKIKALRTMIDTRRVNVKIQVDGGVTVDNTAKLTGAGADILVSGSGFFGANDSVQRFQEFVSAACGSRPERI